MLSKVLAICVGLGDELVVYVRCLRKWLKEVYMDLRFRDGFVWFDNG